APALDEAGRAALSRQMAERVLAAAQPLPVAVVCDDEDVARWAEERGAAVISEPGRGLNGAVTVGVEQLAAAGFAQVIIAHADLPFARSFVWLAELDGITLIPDRHDDGTNVICLPSTCGFEFAYGPGSFGRHVAEATRLGFAPRVLREPTLGWDVDVPADLDGLALTQP
ncbi:MAG TPA: NTP transferase domain-containing protein, partial [Fimbriimonadaceae bacterium]|nr:NTP transferase domain-containing protein [Fimbriimonadaceae bacterium]